MNRNSWSEALADPRETSAIRPPATEMVLDLVALRARIQEKPEGSPAVEEDPVDHWAPRHHVELDGGFGRLGRTSVVRQRRKEYHE